MQEEERKLRLKQLRLILIIMLCVFVAMLSYTIYWCVDYNNQYSDYQQVESDVIQHVIIDDVKYDMLEYQIDDRVYNRHTTKYPSKNDIGDIVTIYFNPDNPYEVIYSHDNNRIILPIICVVFGVAILSLIFVYFLLILDKGSKKYNIDSSKAKNKKLKSNIKK